MLHCANLSLFLQHSETFDVSHVFLTLTIAELSMLKHIRFFGPPCIMFIYKCTLQLYVIEGWREDVSTIQINRLLS